MAIWQPTSAAAPSNLCKYIAQVIAALAHRCLHVTAILHLEVVSQLC